MFGAVGAGKETEALEGISNVEGFPILPILGSIVAPGEEEEEEEEMAKVGLIDLDGGYGTEEGIGEANEECVSIVDGGAMNILEEDEEACEMLLGGAEAVG